MAIKKLRVGVIGVGHIGSNHARLYAEIPSAEFTAVHDVDIARGNAIGKKFGATSARSLTPLLSPRRPTLITRLRGLCSRATNTC
jgi:predicted dehydrogenase